MTSATRERPSRKSPNELTCDAIQPDDSHASRSWPHLTPKRLTAALYAGAATRVATSTPSNHDGGNSRHASRYRVFVTPLVMGR